MQGEKKHTHTDCTCANTHAQALKKKTHSYTAVFVSVDKTVLRDHERQSWEGWVMGEVGKTVRWGGGGR